MCSSDLSPVPGASSPSPDGPAWAVYLAWLVPPFLWFVGMFVFRPGHLLSVLPAFALIAAAVLERAGRGLPRRIPPLVTATVAAGQLALFAAPPIAWMTTVSDCGLPRLQYDEARLRQVTDGLRQVAGDDSGSLVVVTRDGDVTFRNLMYRLPDTRVLWLMDPDSTGVPQPGVEVCEGRHHRVRCDSGKGMWQEAHRPASTTVRLAPEVRAIAWFADPAGPFWRALDGLPTREVAAGSTARLRVTDVPGGPFRIAVGPYAFTRE